MSYDIIICMTSLKYYHFVTLRRHHAIKQTSYLEETVDVDIHSILSVRVEMALKVWGKVVGKMPLHFRIRSENVALELLEEIVEVEVEVARTGTRVGARATRSIVDATFLSIWQNFVSWKKTRSGLNQTQGKEDNLRKLALVLGC